MSDWKPDLFLADLNELRGIVFPFLRSIPAESWSHRTGSRAVDWTVHQVLAHLISISDLLQLGTQAATDGLELDVPIKGRDDLRAFNESDIARLSEFPPNELIAQLEDQFDEIASCLHKIQAEDYEKRAEVYVYNRPIRALDCLDFQLSHIGIIHASQITRIDDSKHAPLWESYSPAMKQRQVDRYLRHFSVAYWPEYAGNLDGAINFHILDDDFNAEWHILVNPAGGSVGKGVKDDALFNLYFAGASVLFGAFTMHINMMNALNEGLIRLEGDFPQAFDLLKLFSASRPARSLDL